MKQQLFIALVLFVVSIGSSTPTTSVGDGNWNNTGTWDTGVVPTDPDDVTIAFGTTVTIDGNLYCNNLIVDGTLQFDNVDSRSLVANGNISVTGMGTIKASAPFVTGDLYQTLWPHGNLTINGTFTATVLGSTSGTRTITVKMLGSNKTIGGTGPMSIPYLDIRGNTTLNVAVNGCINLSLTSGNLDNSTHDITMTGTGFLYRYDAGTISAAPVWSIGNPRVAYYNSSSPITSGNELPSSVNYILMGGGGGVTLNKPITLTGTLEMDNGILISSSTNLLTIGSTASVYASSTSFVNGPVAQTWTTSTATKTFPIGKGSAYRPLDITLNSPSSAVVQAEVFNSNCGGNKGTLNAISTVRYYQTALTSGSATNGGTVQITFDADDGVSDNTSLVVARSTTVNGTYTTLGRSASTTTTVTSNGTGSPYNPASGDFLVLGSAGSDPLPVELTSFTTSAEGKNITLWWKTATEVNNYGFDVERRIVGSSHSSVANWGKIGFVKGNGTSNAPHNYSFTDQSLSPGSYAYRLKQIDNNDAFKYSQEAEVSVEVPKIFTLSQNYPNPFNPSTTIQYGLPARSIVRLVIYNMLGQVVSELINTEQQAGYQSMVWNANVTSGLYFYRIEATSVEDPTKRFVDTKKMLLLK